MKKLAVIGSLAMLGAGVAWAQEAPPKAQQETTTQVLETQIEALCEGVAKHEVEGDARRTAQSD